MKKILQIISPISTYFILASTSFAAPVAAASCTISGMNTLKDIIVRFVVGCVIVRSIYLIIGLSVVVFLWGVSKFVLAEGDEKQGGREFMVWGIVGLFVMVSLYGLVAILDSTFHLSGNYDITPRQVNISL